MVVLLLVEDLEKLPYAIDYERCGSSNFEENPNSHALLSSSKTIR